MKGIISKVVSCVLSLICILQCINSPTLSAFANDNVKYDTCYTKFICEDGAEKYIKSVVKDDCLLVNVAQMMLYTGLEYEEINTSFSNEIRKTANYYVNKLIKNQVDVFDENIKKFSISKQGIDLKYIFQEGKSTATANSDYLGNMSVNLGTDVVSVDDGEGNFSYYVPFCDLCNIFNISYIMEKEYIRIFKADTTVVDILHMQKSLQDYKGNNCLTDAINSDALSSLGLAIGEAITYELEYLLDLKFLNYRDSSLNPLKDNYETIAFQMCSSDIYEGDAIADREEISDFIVDSYEKMIDSILENKNKTYEDYSTFYDNILKMINDNSISLNDFEKCYKNYETINNISKNSEAFGKAVDNISKITPILFRNIAIKSEISAVQDNYVKCTRTYLDYLNEYYNESKQTLPDGIDLVNEKIEKYESKSDFILTYLFDKGNVDNYNSIAADILVSQLDALKLDRLQFTHTIAKWGVNELTYGAFDFKDMYYNSFCNLSFKNIATKTLDHYLNTDLDKDLKNENVMLNTYKQLEWVRLKSYYISNANEIELCLKYYEMHKEDYEAMKYQRESMQYSSQQNKKYLEKSASYEEKRAYDEMKEAEDIYKNVKKSNEENMKKLAAYMAVLLYGIDGTIPEKVQYYEDKAHLDNEFIFNDCSVLYQRVKANVIDSENLEPIENAEVYFTTDDEHSFLCKTNESGIISNVKTEIIVGVSSFKAEDTSSPLETNDTENSDNAFSTYKPETEEVKNILYLPIGTYQLSINANGYKPYEHDRMIEVTQTDICELGEIQIEKQETIWRQLYHDKLIEILQEGIVGSGPFKFDLVYINDDDIPELVISSGQSAMDYSIIFSIVDNQVVNPLGGEMHAGGYGAFQYWYKKNVFIVGGRYTIKIYQFDGTLLYELISTGLSYQDVGVITINGENVTEDEYYEVYNRYYGDTSYRNAAFPYNLNQTTVQKILSDSPQLVLEPETIYEGDTAYTVNAENGVAMYTGPGEYFDTLNITVSNETSLCEKGFMKGLDNWIYTEYNGQEGWVCTDVLTHN